MKKRENKSIMCSRKENAPEWMFSEDQISELICTTLYNNFKSLMGKTPWQALLKSQQLDYCFKVCGLLSNGVNISIGGSSTLSSLLIVWLLNSLWRCPPYSYGRHMCCQVLLGKEMSFQLGIQHLWLSAMLQVACQRFPGTKHRSPVWALLSVLIQ